MSKHTDRIDDRISMLADEISSGKWAASGILELRQSIAQLETALAISRIADVLESKK